MTKLKKLRLPATILLTVLYNYLFWNQNLGVNVLLLLLILIPLLLLLNLPSVFRTNVQLTTLGTVCCAVFVALYGSTVAKVCCIGSLTILVGFIHQPALRTVYNAFLTALASFFYAPASLFQELGSTENSKTQKTFYYLRISLVPILILTIFYWIYKFANPVFDELSSLFWNRIGEYIGMFFTGISFLRILFILLGAILMAAAIFNRTITALLNQESRHIDSFSRTKKVRLKPSEEPVVKGITPHYKGPQKPGFGALYINLKKEYRIACLTIVMVNLLLLIVNTIDVNWLWINFDYRSAGNLAQLVHEGTYLLIFSILLSIGILLYFFNGNLNFIRNNTLLKTLSYVWIAQNAFMALSVGLRNYHYIHQHGLAYKRIGVIIFLVLVTIGLITVLIKLNRTKSSFYLFRVNSWAVYFVMILTCLFNWDMIIVKHNIHHPNKTGIDVHFLLSLSDKTLYELYSHKELFTKLELKNGVKMNGTYLIEERAGIFITTYPKKGWQSFNASEYQAYENLTTLLKKSSEQ